MFGRLTTPVETRHAVFTEFSGSRAGQQSSQLMQGMGELGYPICWNYLEVKCADHSVTIYQDRIKRKRWNNLPCKLILSDRRWTRLSLLRKKKKNIKNFCHQVNDGRIWHWSIVRCLVIYKFYLRLIISKINSPPVLLLKLSLCVGIATLKKSCLSSVTNHSLTLVLVVSGV